MTGAFVVEPPFHMLAPTKALGQTLHAENRSRHVLVRDDGIAYVELQPTTESGHAQLTFQFDGYRTETVSARIAPSARDWVLVGFGEGTVGYNQLSGNMEALKATDVDKDLSIEGRTAFYAKGRVRGEWLLTLAYDSDNHGQNSLGQQIDPNKYYTLYGDGAEQRYDAQTQSKVYVKLERDDFVALFGDFDTGFNQTELTRYTRRMNGARGEYYGDRVRLQGFAAQTNQGFIRDDIRGDGTSGEYHLSHGGVVDQQRNDPHPGARSVQERSRGQRRVADALHRLHDRLRPRHVDLQTTGAVSGRAVQSGVHRRRIRNRRRGCGG